MMLTQGLLNWEAEKVIVSEAFLEKLALGRSCRMSAIRQTEDEGTSSRKGVGSKEKGLGLRLCGDSSFTSTTSKGKCLPPAGEGGRQMI